MSGRFKVSVVALTHLFFHFILMFTGAVQPVQVLLQLVLLAAGLLSVYQRAPPRCPLHLLGPSGVYLSHSLCTHVTDHSGCVTCSSNYLFVSVVAKVVKPEFCHRSPQGFVLIITIIREAVEEIRCYVRDKEVNSQIYSKLSARGERDSHSV